MPDATSRQKQFLRVLGHKGPVTLSKQQASDLIEKLLAAEKASGKQFPCPYCKAKFAPRPSRREKKCPACGRTMVHLCGKLYTSQQADSLYQKDWFKEQQADNKYNAQTDWKEERSFRRQFGDPISPGYIIRVGPACEHARHLDGLLVLHEDANDKPDMLPPDEGCRHDTCECRYDIAPSTVPRGTRIAEPSDKADRQRLVTRHDPQAVKLGKGSCGSALLGWMVVIAYLVSLMR